MTPLLPLIAATFILQACAYDPDNRRDNISNLRNDELVVAINKFLKGLDLDQIVRDVFSLNQGQALMKMNQLRSALNVNKEEIGLILGKFAEFLENYKLDDFSNLNEDQMVTIIQKITSMLRTYQDMIFSKIFSVSDSMGLDKTKAFNSVSNLVEVINILSEPNRIKDVVRKNKNEITLAVNGLVEVIKLFDLEPVIKSIINGMKASSSAN